MQTLYISFTLSICKELYIQGVQTFCTAFWLNIRKEL
jgi:hypothetical protein